MELLACSHSFLEEWIRSQLYGDMTSESHGEVWEIDFGIPICSFNVLDIKEAK